jgi:hypothetical protein
VKAGSLRINCPGTTNRVVLDITANDGPPIRIVRHADKATPTEASNTKEDDEQSCPPAPSAITEALAGIRETMMSETEADAVLAQHVKGYAAPRTAPLMTDGDLGIEGAQVGAAGADSHPSGNPSPQPHAKPPKDDDKQEQPQQADSEIHHITNIVIQRNAATSLLDSITWLNRELAWIVIFLWLVALGIGATAAIVFALGLLNKATA